MKPACRSLLFATLLFVGCQPSNESPTAPVSGMVTVNGEPLALGTIILETPGSRPATGQILEGTIHDVMTYEPGDGAPVGEHKVAITAMLDVAGGGVAENPGQVQDFDPNYMGGGDSLIPSRYNDPATSGLTATIKPGVDNVLQFNLESK